MEIIETTRCMVSRSNHVHVAAYTAKRVLKKVPPYRDSVLGRTVDHVMLPEFERYMPVRLPRSVYDYPRYRNDVIEAKRLCKAFVVRQYLKKYPLGAC